MGVIITTYTTNREPILQVPEIFVPGDLLLRTEILQLNDASRLQTS